MSRTYLIEARKQKDLNQQELADLLRVERKAVNRWEMGTNEPSSLQRKAIRGILDSNDPHLFDNFGIQGSFKGFRELMEMLRRQFMEALAQIGGTALFGNVSLALVSSPMVEPEEYLAQCAITIDACWEWLYQRNYTMAERALQANIPTLARLANTIAPYQTIAANLAFQAKIMQARLAIHKLNYLAREVYCVEAVRFAQLSGNRALLAIALDWQGMTYVLCFRQPERAIPLFNTALSSLDNDSSLLVKSALYIDLSVAYAQDTTQEHFETKALDYAELARIAMPSYPELDPFYQCVFMGQSELEQAEGNMYLHLAEHFPTSDYGLRAYDTFNKATSKQSLSQGYRAQALIRKADSLRSLGQMDESVKCLSDGLLIGIEIKSKKPLREISDVLNNIPPTWKHETSILNLQKELAHAITVTQ